MSDQAVHRYTVPVDDQWHMIELSGPILHVGSRDHSLVEMWALHTGGPTTTRYCRVFGTGQPLRDSRAQHLGTAVTDSGLVWHLFERVFND